MTRTREEIRAIALARPRDVGEPGTRWSLTTLRRYLIRSRVVTAISKEHLRRVLQSMGITAQRTRTWKWSNDPLFEAKKAWVLAAYKARRGRHHRRGRRVASTSAGRSRSNRTPGRAGSPRAGRPASGPPTTAIAAPGSCWAPMTSAPTGCGATWRTGGSPARSCWSSSTTSVAATRPRSTVYIVMDNLSGPLDAGDPPWAVDRQRRAVAHTDQRQSPQPHRVPLLGLRRVRHQRQRLPRLDRVLQSHPGLHPTPQPRPPRPPHHRTREPPQGRLSYRRTNPRRPTSSWAHQWFTRVTGVVHAPQPTTSPSRPAA